MFENAELTQFIKGRIKLYQSKEGYRFNLDPVLLSHFIKINKKSGNLIDLGTGSGIIIILLSLKYPKLNFFAVELQESLYSLAKENFKINGLDVNLINEDIKNLRKIFPLNSFDYAVSNPPYFKLNSSTPKNIEEKLAKFEVKLTLDDLFKTVKYLLKDRGKFFIIYPVNRLSECLKVSSKNNLELKRLRFVHPDINSNSTHFLAEFIKSGKEGSVVEKPLIVYEDRKKKIYTQELKYILEKFTDGEDYGN